MALITYKKNLNIKQSNLFSEIQKNYNYLLFARYFDLTVNEFNVLKNQLQTDQTGLLKIKKSILPLQNKMLQGQGAVMICYGSTFSDIQTIIKILILHKKIEPLFVSYSKKVISILQLQTQCLNNSYSLPFILQYPLFQFYNTLLKIAMIRRV